MKQTFTFSEPKYSAKKFPTKLLFRNPRIIGNLFRKVFILFHLGVFLVSLALVLYAGEILRGFLVD